MRSAEELGLIRAEWLVIINAVNKHLFHRDSAGQMILSAKLEIMPHVQDFLLERDDDSDEAGVNAVDQLLARLSAFSDEDWETVLAVVEGFWDLAPDVRSARVPGNTTEQC